MQQTFCPYRYGPTGPPKPIFCKHNKKRTSYHCEEISRKDQINFHRSFFSNEGKISSLKLKQDGFIVKYTDALVPKKVRLINGQRGPKSMSINYFIYSKDKKSKLRVCQKAFLNTLTLSKNRVNGVVRRHYQSGKMPIEQRGGDRKSLSFKEKKNSIINFIKTFKAVESHYCRSKSANRVYLSSDLNINKMWKYYNAQINDENLKVKSSYFRYIFRHNFNIGFGSPQSDACSTCISLSERIKRETNKTRKQDLMVEKRVHKLKAKTFFKYLQENRDDILIITFDCQKNQVLPRVPDQSAYYSRQIYKYNLTVVLGNSKNKQLKENVFIYHWDESEYGRGSNEVSSAICHFLTSIVIPEKVKVIRLAADGCGGQNKNYFVMGMLCSWLKENAPSHIKIIEYLFPMVGHSFLPPDRVFGRIERKIKKLPTIINPDQYTEIFSEYGKVISLSGINYDWKKTVTNVVRPPGQWPIDSFNACKRFFFKLNKKKDNVLVKCEVHYKTETQKFKNICKRNKKIADLASPNLIQPGVPIAPLKKRDVDKLLVKHFGNDWRILESLLFFKTILGDRIDVSNEDDDEEAVTQDGCENFVESLNRPQI